MKFRTAEEIAALTQEEITAMCNEMSRRMLMRLPANVRYNRILVISYVEDLIKEAESLVLALLNNRPLELENGLMVQTEYSFDSIIDAGRWARAYRDALNRLYRRVSLWENLEADNDERARSK